MIWQIEATKIEPIGNEGRTWTKPCQFAVIAETLEEAIKKLRKEHPQVILIKIFKDRHLDGIIR